MIVKEFCDNQVLDLPEKFYKSIPMYCPDCHYPMEMSEALTQLHCGNPRCVSKVTQRLVAMANQLGVKDMGVSRAQKYIKAFKVKNPLLIFSYNPDTDGSMGEGISVETSNKIVNQFKAKNSFTLAEYVKIANLPFIQSSATAIFGGYDSLETAYADIEKGGVNFIAQKLSIKSSEDDEESTSIRAIKVFETLSTFKDDLFQAIDSVNIIKTNVEGMTKILAVCSDEVGSPFKTKADFYATVNNLYPEIHVEFGNSVTKKTEYLVWAGAQVGTNARVTNKVKKARAYNEQYENNKQIGKTKEGDHEIQIVTATDFLQYLEGLHTGN
jgi:hypothetical protein